MEGDPEFGFERDFSVDANHSGESLKHAWAGGLNSCQFCPVDLNFDGLDDLVVFDRNGNKLLTFVNHGTSGETDYVYDPAYQGRFPQIKEWIQLKDYNGDGLRDIFTYTTGGIRVYDNVSTDVLEFEMSYPLVYSYYYSGSVNLFALTDDYPVIEDIDGDGDLDILNFWTLGMYLHYHRNMSVERYGHTDTLDFQLEHECWGHFLESESSNQLTLDINCGFSDAPQGGERHSGSTMLSLDMNGDAVMDLLLGDVDFPNIIGMINGGTLDSAHIISQDTLWPGGGEKIWQWSMPLPMYLDIDNDAINELIVSPFDPSPDRAENRESVWLYENSGSNNQPLFSLVKKNFMQDQMIDVGAGAYPVLHDYDKDGLPDLFIGNYGLLDSTYYSFGYLYFIYKSAITLYRNTGTAGQPEFEFVTDDYASMSSLRRTGLYPAFADLDGDGDDDMLLGCTDGSIIFCENSAGTGNLPEYAQPVLNFQGIDVGGSSTPQLIDLNKDGLTDLVVGEEEGQLNYFENQGSISQAVFVLVTDKLGDVDVTNPQLSYAGYSTPCFFEYQGSMRLFVGSEFGEVFYYKDIDDNLEGSFTLYDDHLLYIDDGDRTAVAVWNYNDDEYPDMIMGNYSGGLTFFRGITAPPAAIDEQAMPVDAWLIFPNPAKECLHIQSQTKNAASIDYIISGLGGRVLEKADDIPLPASISLHHLQKGIYFLQIKDVCAQSVQVKRFVRY